MKSYDPYEPLVSVHIPKCAGSSFSRVLKHWFKGNYLRHYHNEQSNKPPKKHKLVEGVFTKRKRRGLCIHGHFNNNRGNGISDYYPTASQVITVIRDPFDLHVSNYFYVKREALGGGGGSFRSGKPHPIVTNQWNLEQFLENNKRSYITNFLPAQISLDNYESIIESQFLFMGVSDQLQNVVDKLGEILGYETLPVPVSNVSQWDEPIPDGARAEFASRNPLEFAIYDYAKDRWGDNKQGPRVVAADS